MTTIKEMVANDRKVRFTHYKSGELWYVTDCGFSFPVPIADAGDGSFLSEDKALLFMRYIRKHKEVIDEARAAAQRGSQNAVQSP